MILRKAHSGELSEIVGLYRSAIGTEGCVWDENYPTEEDALIDLACGGLYVLSDGGEIVGAVSVLGENELEELNCWTVRDGNHCEIVRVVVSQKRRGEGLSKVMLKLLFEKLKQDGITSIRLIAAKGNAAALKTYEALGFTYYDECFMFGHCYLPAEKRLRSGL